MSEREYVDTEEVPSRGVGKVGQDWAKILGEIPEGKAWKVPAENGEFSIGTLRNAVKKINDAGEDQYEAVSRTIDGETFLFVSRK